MRTKIVAMGEPATSLGVTFAEYCAFEGALGTRYELFNGEILAMNQPTLEHAALQASLALELLKALGGRCQVLGPMGVHCEATGEAFGPDLIVLCDPPSYDRVVGRALTNPSAIVEILSPSTSQVDAHEKLHAYKTITSLQAYVLVSQKRRLVQIHRRVGDAWLLEEVSSGTFRVGDADVTIDAVYAQIARLQERS